MARRQLERTYREGMAPEQHIDAMRVKRKVGEPLEKLKEFSEIIKMLNEGSTGLAERIYSENDHCVEELIQNVRDAQLSLSDGELGDLDIRLLKSDPFNAMNVKLIASEQKCAFPPDKSLKQDNGCLILCYNERGFRWQDVESICFIGESTKREGSGKFVGEKGQGFKAVFNIANFAYVLSDQPSSQYFFRLREHKHPLCGVKYCYNERGFRWQDVESICFIGESTKREGSGKFVGEKGQGFKAVFNIANFAYVLSDQPSSQYFFRLREHKHPLCGVKYIVPDYLPRASLPEEVTTIMKGRTCLCLSMKKDDRIDAYDIIHKKIAEKLQPECFLFLDKPDKIKITAEHKTKRRVEKVLMRTVTQHGENYQVIQLSVAEGGSTHSRRYLLVEQEKQVPQEIRDATETRKSAERRAVWVAFNLDDNDKQNVAGFLPIARLPSLFTYLPTAQERTGLPALVNADWRLASNRETLESGSGAWNAWLRDELVIPTYVEALGVVSSLAAFAHLLPRFIPQQEGSQPSKHFAKVAENIITQVTDGSDGPLKLLWCGDWDQDQSLRVSGDKSFIPDVKKTKRATGEEDIVTEFRQMEKKLLPNDGDCVSFERANGIVWEKYADSCDDWIDRLGEIGVEVPVSAKKFVEWLHTDTAKEGFLQAEEDVWVQIYEFFSLQAFKSRNADFRNNIVPIFPLRTLDGEIKTKSQGVLFKDGVALKPPVDGVGCSVLAKECLPTKEKSEVAHSFTTEVLGVTAFDIRMYLLDLRSKIDQAHTDPLAPARRKKATDEQKLELTPEQRAKLFWWLDDLHSKMMIQNKPALGSLTDIASVIPDTLRVDGNGNFVPKAVVDGELRPEGVIFMPNLEGKWPLLYGKDVDETMKAMAAASGGGGGGGKKKGGASSSEKAALASPMLCLHDAFIACRPDGMTVHEAKRRLAKAFESCVVDLVHWGTGAGQAAAVSKTIADISDPNMAMDKLADLARVPLAERATTEEEKIRYLRSTGVFAAWEHVTVKTSVILEKPLLLTPRAPQFLVGKFLGKLDRTPDKEKNDKTKATLLLNHLCAFYGPLSLSRLSVANESKKKTDATRVEVGGLMLGEIGFFAIFAHWLPAIMLDIKESQQQQQKATATAQQQHNKGRMEGGRGAGQQQQQMGGRLKRPQPPAPPVAEKPAAAAAATEKIEKAIWAPPAVVFDRSLIPPHLTTDTHVTHIPLLDVADNELQGDGCGFSDAVGLTAGIPNVTVEHLVHKLIGLSRLSALHLPEDLPHQIVAAVAMLTYRMIAHKAKKDTDGPRLREAFEKDELLIVGKTWKRRSQVIFDTGGEQQQRRGGPQQHQYGRYMVLKPHGYEGDDIRSLIQMLDIPLEPPLSVHCDYYIDLQNRLLQRGAGAAGGAVPSAGHQAMQGTLHAMKASLRHIADELTRSGNRAELPESFMREAMVVTDSGKLAACSSAVVVDSDFWRRPVDPLSDQLSLAFTGYMMQGQLSDGFMHLYKSLGVRQLSHYLTCFPDGRGEETTVPVPQLLSDAVKRAFVQLLCEDKSEQAVMSCLSSPRTNTDMPLGAFLCAKEAYCSGVRASWRIMDWQTDTADRDTDKAPLPMLSTDDLPVQGAFRLRTRPFRLLLCEEYLARSGKSPSTDMRGDMQLFDHLVHQLAAEFRLSKDAKSKLRSLLSEPKLVTLDEVSTAVDSKINQVLRDPEKWVEDSMGPEEQPDHYQQEQQHLGLFGRDIIRQGFDESARADDMLTTDALHTNEGRHRGVFYNSGRRLGQSASLGRTRILSGNLPEISGVRPLSRTQLMTREREKLNKKGPKGQVLMKRPKFSEKVKRQSPLEFEVSWTDCPGADKYMLQIFDRSSALDPTKTPEERAEYAENPIDAFVLDKDTRKKLITKGETRKLEHLHLYELFVTALYKKSDDETDKDKEQQQQQQDDTHEDDKYIKVKCDRAVSYSTNLSTPKWKMQAVKRLIDGIDADEWVASRREGMQPFTATIKLAWDRVEGAEGYDVYVILSSPSFPFGRSPKRFELKHDKTSITLDELRHEEARLACHVKIRAFHKKQESSVSSITSSDWSALITLLPFGGVHMTTVDTLEESDTPHDDAAAEEIEKVWKDVKRTSKKGGRKRRNNNDMDEDDESTQWAKGELPIELAKDCEYIHLAEKPDEPMEHSATVEPGCLSPGVHVAFHPHAYEDTGGMLARVKQVADDATALTIDRLYIFPRMCAFMRTHIAGNTREVLCRSIADRSVLISHVSRVVNVQETDPWGIPDTQDAMDTDEAAADEYFCRYKIDRLATQTMHNGLVTYSVSVSPLIESPKRPLFDYNLFAQQMDKRCRWTVGDLFAGGGAAALGLWQAGIRTSWAIEKDSVAHALFKANMNERYAHTGGDADLSPAPPACDVHDLDVYEVLRGIIHGKAGCPLPYATRVLVATSTSLNMGNDASRLRARQSDVVHATLAAAKILQPEYVVLESPLCVLSSSADTATLMAFYSLASGFLDAGYAYNIQAVRACDYGVPNTRTHLMCVARRADVTMTSTQELFPKPIDARVCVREAIGDLPSISGPLACHENGGYRTYARKGTLCVYQKDMRDIVNNRPLRNHVFVSSDEHHHPSQSSQSSPSACEWQQIYTHTNVITMHPDPKQKRPLTVREYGRLWSFPDSFFFSAGITQHQINIIVASTPPLVLKHIAMALTDGDVPPAVDDAHPAPPAPAAAVCVCVADGKDDKKRGGGRKRPLEEADEKKDHREGGGGGSGGSKKAASDKNEDDVDVDVVDDDEPKRPIRARKNNKRKLPDSDIEEEDDEHEKKEAEKDSEKKKDKDKETPVAAAAAAAAAAPVPAAAGAASAAASGSAADGDDGVHDEDGLRMYVDIVPDGQRHGGHQDQAKEEEAADSTQDKKDNKGKDTQKADSKKVSPKPKAKSAPKAKPQAEAKKKTSGTKPDAKRQKKEKEEREGDHKRGQVQSSITQFFGKK
ncbi:unnamed protein product [Vitrella brassicaformis CCMP3155]|uniref:Protein NO VEIN C-terminal domain-containing protein n=2 Tax=Vitrella brassicaformis TaxID=1169539 RepID=A0A0G4FAZ0_VITBC|nr:unnamed protein product [Vitrella brassicaformis CCMP3155]|eukprot:CEM10068.1 unnamed protein product [Vitrella brassicaformis CCMP3155]